MSDPAQHVSFLPPVVVFCAAAVVGVPLARVVGLSSVVGYLIAGLVVGPSGLGFVSQVESVRVVAEIGVVLLLFVIGLELEMSRLWALRRDILGLGAAQVIVTAAFVAAAGWFLGLPVAGAVVTGLALALSATAVAMQLLGERGEVQSPHGQRTFAVLLFQDLSIVPILALVAVLGSSFTAKAADMTGLAIGIGKGIGAIVGIVLVGRFVLNPMFRLLATKGGREVMSAAALLVVLGAALAMEMVGLSMALGAFLAGVLLAESHFRHQLEADIEPFRGLLLGLFFMSVGMGIDIGFVARNAMPLLAIVVGLLVVKIAVAWTLLRITGSNGADATRAALLLSPAGEFSFVVLPLAAGAALMPGDTARLLVAAAAGTMFLGPILAKLGEAAMARREAKAATAAVEPEESFTEATGHVLVIGFGRFGQLVTQVLLAAGTDVTVIDNDVEMIKVAGRFGFKVYYGDGRRLDVLRAAGAERVGLVAICVDDKQASLEIARIVHAEFPLARSYVRAYDRIHALELMNLDVDFQVRETVESALALGRAALVELGLEAERVTDIVTDVRKRDIARLSMQRAEGMMGGRELAIYTKRVSPEPLTPPKRAATPLTPETRAVIQEATGR